MKTLRCKQIVCPIVTFYDDDEKDNKCPHCGVEVTV